MLTATIPPRRPVGSAPGRPATSVQATSVQAGRLPGRPPGSGSVQAGSVQAGSVQAGSVQAGSVQAGRPPGSGPVRPAVSPPALRRARLAALAVGGFLLPWSALLALALPGTARVQHWALAWAGLDAAEAVAALATAVLLGRAGTRAALAAAATGTLLLTDAWFDLCTSAPGTGQILALAEAAGAEVPLAMAAWWLAARLLRGSR